MRTDVQRIVVATETVNECLLRCCVVLHDPVGLAVLRNRLGFGRRRDWFSKALTGDLGSQIERRGLANGDSKWVVSTKDRWTYEKLSIRCSMRVNESDLIFHDHTRLCKKEVRCYGWSIYARYIAYCFLELKTSASSSSIPGQTQGAKASESRLSALHESIKTKRSIEPSNLHSYRIVSGSLIKHQTYNTVRVKLWEARDGARGAHSIGE